MDYDFAIVGGGLVGSLAALLLGEQGFQVALIDPKQPTPLRDIPDLRVSALTPFSWQILETAAVVAELDPQRYSKILGMKIFENLDDPLNFYASEVGRDRLGVIIENEVLLQAIQRCFPENVHRIYEVFSLSPRTINSKFLILAQGNNPSLTRQFNIPYTIFDYQEEALIFHVESEQPHEHSAYQRFLPKPLAFLPLYNPHWSSIVWTLSRQDAQRLKALTPEELAQKVEQAFPVLGSLKIISEIAAFPMLAQQAKVVAGEGFVLMGDAAHIVHPLAGQGVNLGFRDVAAFSKIITEVPNLTEPSIKDRYHRATQKYNQGMSYGFSATHFLYDCVPLTKLRQISASQLNRCIPLKKELMKFAMGERFAPL